MYKVIEKEVLNPIVTKMIAEAPAVMKKVLAGQFIILRVYEDEERIPLATTGYNREKGTITIIFQIIGKTTMLLSQLNVEGSILGFVGPLGRSSHVDGHKKVCVIDGGVGCAIAYPTAKTLHENDIEVTVVMGFRSKDLVILEEESKQVSTYAYPVSNDGSTSVKGLVTNVLGNLINKEGSSDEVITIGPLITMKFVCQLTEKCGIRTVASVNPIMIDDVRICGGRRLGVGGETKFACADGLDFDDHLMDSDEAMSRGTMYRDFEAYARNVVCNLMNEEVR